MSQQAPVSQPWIPRLQTLLLTALVIYLAWLGAALIWYVLYPEGDKVMMLSSGSQARSEAQTERLRQPERYHLFGREGVKKVVQADRPKEAPKTRLRLILKGVFTAEQGGESGAIVEEIGKPADYYRIGDTLPGNAVLEEVYSDRILLRRDGRLETLAFEDEVELGQSRIASVAPRTNSSTQAEINTPEQFVEEATRRLSENPEQALKSVGLAQAEDGGYVYQGNNPMLAGMNLQKGDVIRSVNGHTLGDIQKDKALMGSLYEQGSLEVEVVRDGASFYINYPLR